MTRRRMIPRSLGCIVLALESVCGATRGCKGYNRSKRPAMPDSLDCKKVLSRRRAPTVDSGVTEGRTPMPRCPLPYVLTLSLSVLSMLSVPSPALAAGPVSPESFLGHKVGADRKLAPWPRVVEYLRLVDAASDRVSIESAGTSTLGNDMPVVVLTSEANQANLERYREIARRLAHPEDLSAEQARALAAEGKTIALVTCSIHSSEVGSTQMAMEFVHDVATTQDPRMLAWLDDVILLLMPSIN